MAGTNVLLGVTGGIAAYKAALLVRLLTESGADVHVVMTPAATRFVGPDTFAALTRHPVQANKTASITASSPTRRSAG